MTGLVDPGVGDVEAVPGLGAPGRGPSPVAASVMAAVAALGMGALILALTGSDPVAALVAMADGAVGSRRAWIQLLTFAVPLVLIALGLSLCFRAGIYNIGGEGQFLLAAMTTLAVGLALDGVPAPVAIALTLASGALVGALWGLVPGVLKARLGINEVISSLLLNYIAAYIFAYSYRKPLRNPGGLFLGSREIPAQIRLGTIPWLGVHSGLLIALAAVPIVAWVVRRTPTGFRVTFFGANPDAAPVVRIESARLVVGLFIAAGVLAGLAGAIQLMGVSYKIQSGISPGFGFTAIIVTLLGRNTAGGVVLASLFIAAVTTGGRAMAVSEQVPFGIVLVIQGLFVVFLMLADRLGRRS